MYTLKELDTCMFSDYVMCDCTDCSQCEHYNEIIAKKQSSTQMDNEQLSMFEDIKYERKHRRKK